MTFEQLEVENYILNDGEILSIQIGFPLFSDKIVTPSKATIIISARQYLKNNKYRPCILTLILEKITKIRIFDDEEISGNYSDITFTRLENENIYISFDPFGNTNKPNDEDNYVFIAKEINIKE